MWHRIRVEKSFAFEKADKGGGARAFQSKGRYEGFDGVVEVDRSCFGDFQT